MWQVEEELRQRGPGAVRVGGQGQEWRAGKAGQRFLALPGLPCPFPMGQGIFALEQDGRVCGEQK